MYYKCMANGTRYNYNVYKKINDVYFYYTMMSKWASSVNGTDRNFTFQPLEKTDAVSNMPSEVVKYFFYKELLE